MSTTILERIEDASSIKKNYIKDGMGFTLTYIPPPFLNGII
jgi:hypothetical protein